MTLYLLRKKLKLTAADVAERLQISRGHYSHLENGSRVITDEWIDKISTVLGVPRTTVSAIAEANNEKIIPNSWIFKIPIDGKPFVQAFQEFVKTMGRKQLSSNETEDLAAKFITYRIEHSVRTELKNNPVVTEYLMGKLS